MLKKKVVGSIDMVEESFENIIKDIEKINQKFI